MKVVVLYYPQSEHARLVEEFAEELSRRYDRKLELISVATREGSAMASLYDIMQYPAILALRDDGSLLKSWEGPILPLMDEIVYYTPDRLQTTSF